MTTLLSNSANLNEYYFFITQGHTENLQSKENTNELCRLIYNITDNTKNINSMLVSKYNLVAKIQSMLKLKSRSKEKLTDRQIESFREFNRHYTQHCGNVNQTLTEIETSTMGITANEMLNNNSPCESLYKRLLNIIIRQFDVINSLTVIISAARLTLAVL